MKNQHYIIKFATKHCKDGRTVALQLSSGGAMEKKTIKNTTEFQSAAGEQEVPATYVIFTGGIQPDGVAALFKREKAIKDGMLYRFG